MKPATPPLLPRRRILFLIVTTILASGLATGAQVTLTNKFEGVNKVVPDGQLTGITDTHELSFTNDAFFNITNVQLTLRVDGGYNGDLYGYLVHDSGFAVLFNREGRTTANSHGYGQRGFDITFADSGNDLHWYEQTSFELNSEGRLAGTWGPDGRRVDPGSVDDTAPRTALLGSFNGLNPDGRWTLFLADLDFGEQATLVDWSLVITAVPEPAPVGLLCFAAGVFLLARRWRIGSRIPNGK